MWKLVIFSRNHTKRTQPLYFNAKWQALAYIEDNNVTAAYELTYDKAYHA